jgi:protein-S-isoprenylcysteine O-methyltransferase Ste14
MKPTRALVKAFIIAPLNIMLTVPALILWISGKGEFFSVPVSLLRIIAGATCLFVGIYIIFRALPDLTDRGKDGTPAPWDPSKNLVVNGIYSKVRNPMISGISFVLLAEAMIVGSSPLLLWFILWIAGNLIYTPLIEEPELEKRFGVNYLKYKENVPRWIPLFNSQEKTKE